jgi:hypothetical protein
MSHPRLAAEGKRRLAQTGVVIGEPAKYVEAGAAPPSVAAAAAVLGGALGGAQPLVKVGG